jgi:hypothetical protein
MTHSELVQIGANYMRYTMRCSPVVTERGSMRHFEKPDVFGWRQQPLKDKLAGKPFDTVESILFECKVSRADFLKDQKKRTRVDGGTLGMGRYRYYFAPAGLIRPDELPENWGLIEVKDGKSRLVAHAEYFDGIDVLRREIYLFRSLAQELERLKGLAI